MCSIAHSQEEIFNLSTSNFQLGAWSPRRISFKQSQDKIKKLDDWFNSLSPSERSSILDEYIINRNRLFIVAQEKRMDYQLQSGDLNKIFGSTKGIKELRAEALQHRAAMKKISSHYLNNPDALKKELFEDLDDIGLALPNDLKKKDADYSSLFAPSISKTSSSGSNLLSLEAEAYSTSLPSLNQSGSRIDIKKGIAQLRDMQRNILLPNYGMKSSCKKLDDSTIPLKDYFDSSKNSRIAKFLNELNVSQTLSPKKSNDLSSWYGEPTFQYPEGTENYNATCVGHAIASNATAALYKDNNIKINAINKPVSFNPDHVFALAKSNEQNASSLLKLPPPKINSNSNEYCNPSSFNANFYSGIIKGVSKSISLFKKFPLCSTVKEGNELYKIDQFSAIELKDKDLKPNFEVLKAMIDSGSPPMVGIDSDVRYEREGWLQINPRRELTHIVNVVGYDEGIDPWTLCPTKYFIVRDSLGKKKIHYKIAADNLLSHIDGMYSISKLHKVAQLDQNQTDDSDSKHMQ